MYGVRRGGSKSMGFAYCEFCNEKIPFGVMNFADHSVECTNAPRLFFEPLSEEHLADVILQILKFRQAANPKRYDPVSLTGV